MDKRNYANHADAVFTVFEMLRKELAVPVRPRWPG
jgi:hypothetical protein